MNTPRFLPVSRRRACFALLSALTTLTPLSGAILTWDPANTTNGTTIDAGSGTWSTSAGLLWNNAGTNIEWAQTSATAALNSATFAGVDAPENTYVVNLAASVAVNGAEGSGLRFSNSGYKLTADIGTTHTLSTSLISVVNGKTANISGPITIRNATSAVTLGGFGTLILSDGVLINSFGGNKTINAGSKVTVKTGATLTGTGSIVVGGGTSTTTATDVKVEGGTMSITNTDGAAITSVVISNFSSGTVTSTLTLSSGTISNTTPGGGVRFGPNSAATGAAGVLATLNLDGGTLTAARLFEFGGTANTINSVLNLNGGTLRATPNTLNASTFLQNLNAANVKAGGAIIDTNGAAITIAQALTADSVSLGGGLTKLGAGTLTLTGANTYTGATTISAGTLNINAPYSALTATTVAPAARLQITSGASASTIPALTLQAGAVVGLELGLYNAGALATANVSTLDAEGNYTIDLSGTNIPTGTYTILSYTSKTGTGTPSVGSLPPGVTATVQDTGSAIILTVLTPQLVNYTWTAATNTNWDLSSVNWTPSTYTEGALVTFPNLPGDNTINLSADRSPYSVSIQNTTPNSYTFTGGAIAGSATVSKTGTGVATFAAANSYTGATTISQGALFVPVNSALGSTAGGTTISEGALLGLTGGVNYSTTEPIFCSGGGNTVAISGITATQRGVIQSVSGHSVFSGPISITAAGATRFGVQTGASLTLSGTISLAPGVSNVSVRLRSGENDGDFITLSGANNHWDLTTGTFTGSNTGNSGVRLGIDNALPPGVSITGSGSFTGTANTLDLNGFNQTMPGLVQSDGNLQISNLKAGTTSIFTLDTAAIDYTNVPGTPNVVSTLITDGPVGTGKVAVVKKGSFKQTLQGVHTYTGATTLEAGTLAFQGTGTLAATPVTMLAGTTLDVSAIDAPEFVLSGGISGSGTVTATGKLVTVSTTFAPGALAVSGDLALGAGTDTTLVASTTLGEASALTVTGTLTLRGDLVINEAAGFDLASGQTLTFATGTISTGLDSVMVNGVVLTESADVWTGTHAGLTYTFTEATATLGVSGGVVMVSPLQAWRDLYFPSEGNDGTGIGANLADPDNDGIANLLEYATNTSPVVAGAPAVTQTTDAGRLTLTFPRIDDPALRYTVEGRDDLVTGNWSAISPTAANNPTFGFAGSNPTSTETIQETVIDPVLLSTQPKRFLRLKVDVVQ